MMKYLLILLLLIPVFGYAQDARDGIYLEGKALQHRNQTLNFRNSFSNSTGTLFYEETQSVSIDSTGKWWLALGGGTPTGGTVGSLRLVPFATDTVLLQVEVDFGSGFVSLVQDQLNYVPYAYHAFTTEETRTLGGMLGDTSGLSNSDNLLFLGTWTFGPINFANHALQVDSVRITSASVFAPIAYQADSSNYTPKSDTAQYASQVSSSDSATVSGWSDTTLVADTIPAWNLSGMVLANDYVLGSTNQSSLLFRTNNTNRLLLDSMGWNIGTSVDTGAIRGVFNGFRMSNSGGTGVSSPLFSEQLHLTWSSDRSTMNMGITPDSLLAAPYVGNYNFVHGRNNYVASDYSIVVGENNYFTGPANYCFAVGKGHFSTERYSFLAGRNCYSGFARNVAMGDSCQTPSGYSCVALGSNANAHGNTLPATAIGWNIDNTGRNSTVFGYKVRMNKRRGTFVYSDYSTEDTLDILAVNGNFDRMHIRAVGGVKFYTDSTLLTGVALAPGSGSWSSTSSRFSKDIVGHVPSLREVVMQMPISTWSYKGQSTLHIGPMAQDFSLLGYGESNRMINTLDIDGVVLSGILELNQQLDALQEEVDLLEKEEEPSFEEINLRLDQLLQKLTDEGK